MAFTHNLLISSFLLIFVLPCILAKSSSLKPKALIFQVTKDASTLQHITYITYKHPLTPVKLSVDLGGHSSWVDCETSYNSTTYKLVDCKSPKCKLDMFNSCSDGCEYDNLPMCIRNQCFTNIYTPFTDEIMQISMVSQDVILIQSTDGEKLSQVATIKDFIFTCLNNYLTHVHIALPKGVAGAAAFGRSATAFPTQLATNFNFPRKFGVCLSSTTKKKGFIILGDGPYVTFPNIDISKNLVYTPFITYPSGNDLHLRPSTDYFIGVKSIKIGSKTLKLNTTLLSINKEGHGGTKISSATPYTLLETSIFKVVTQEFVKQLKNAKRVAAVTPFSFCFSSINFSSSATTTPFIDFVLQKETVYWRMKGANLMVQVNKNVMCLGILERGEVDIIQRAATSIIIGSHQIEDHLLQFDLVQNRLGFSSALSAQRTSCGSFNY